MTFQVTFKTDQFFKEMENQKKRIPRIRSSALKITSRRLYENIFKKWPKDTWYSSSNFHVNINFLGQMPLEPPQRPSMPGESTGRAFKNRQEQLEKIESKKDVKMVFIGNTVDYAPNVAFKKGLGRKIVEEAKDQVERTIGAELGLKLRG